MPIYEYQCASCGHNMDILQKISDPAPARCPECHEDAMKKQVTAAAFKLKGTGWYETDFKNKKDDKKNANKPAANKKTDKKSADAANKQATPTKNK